MTPCKINKCIRYPVCQNQKNINCPDIGNYYIKLRENLTRAGAWGLIKEDLKCMITFTSGANGTDEYVYLEEVPYLDTDDRVFGQEPI